MGKIGEQREGDPFNVGGTRHETYPALTLPGTRLALSVALSPRASSAAAGFARSCAVSRVRLPGPPGRAAA